MRVNQTRAALYALCFSRAGYRHGAELIEFIEHWREGVEKHDRSITIEDFIAWSPKLSRRTAYRRLKLFRDTFPELGAEGTPEGLMGPLLRRLASEVEVGA